MNLVKCSKGHFYDSDRYSSCPHCVSAGVAEESMTISMPSGLSDAVTVASLSDVTVAVGPQDNSEPVTVAGDSIAMSDPVTQRSSENMVTGRLYTNPSEETEITAGEEPVVGWLVCISGRYYGKSFPLKGGRNFIGRSRQMDVCLEGESSVSRDRHGVVIYEPRKRTFLVQPGDSRELFYLNDKVVLDNQKLEPYDVISLGKTEMMLIPFCTDKFAWEDLEKKDDET